MLLVKSNVLKNSVKNLPRPLLAGISILAFPLHAAPLIGTDTGSYVSILLSLIVVVALIFGLGLIMRRFNVTQTGSAQMKVVSTMALGNKERIMVIEVGEQQFLLGITSHNINHLAQLEQPLDTANQGESFKKRLAQFMHPPKGADDE